MACIKKRLIYYAIRTVLLWWWWTSKVCRMHAINRSYVLVPYSLHKSFEMQFHSFVCSVCHVIHSNYINQRFRSHMDRCTRAPCKIMSH
jgi:hypothetical protein